MKNIIRNLSVVIILVGSSFAQPPAGTDTLAAAEFEFTEATRIYSEASQASTASAYEVTNTRFRNALERFTKARDLFRELGDRRREAYCLAWIAKAYEVTGDRPNAIVNYAAAITIFRELGDTLEVGNQNANLGLIYFGAKDYNKAIHHYNEALKIAREVKNARLEALALSVIGQNYSALYQRQTAISYWEQAAKVSEAAGDESAQAFTLNLIASAHKDMGDRHRALSVYSKVLELYRKQSGNAASHMQSVVIRNMATLVSQLGDHRNAIKLDQTALAIQQSIGAKHEEADTLKRIAVGYSNIGDNRSSIQFLERSLVAYRNLGNSAGEIAALDRLSDVYLYNLSDPKKALPYAEQALALARSSKQVASEAAALASIGGIYSYLPDGRAKGIEHLLKALDLYRSLKDFESVADTLRNIGVEYYLLDDNKAAIASLEEALLTYIDYGIPLGIPETLKWLRAVWASAGNARFATWYGKHAVFSFQNLRQKIRLFDETTQRTYLRSIEDSYRELIALLLDQGRRLEAHQIITMFKDEQSLDVVDLPDNAPLRGPTFTPRESRYTKAYLAVFQEIRDLRTKISGLALEAGGRVLTADEQRNLESLEKQVTDARQKLLDQSRAAAVEFAKPATEQDVIAALPENAMIWKIVTDLSEQHNAPVVAIYQMIGEYRAHFLVFSRDEVTQVSVSKEGINEKARTLWALLQSDKYDPRPVGKELYEMVFRPVENTLPPGTKTILWSLDGNLRYVPMAALFDGKQYLAERFDHVTFTRTDADRLTQPISPNWSATGLGSSKAHSVQNNGEAISFGALPGVANELNTLFSKKRTAVLEGDVLLDEAFTQKAMLDRLREKRPVAHIASHFSFRPGDDSRSFLLLGDGTPFTLADMKKHKDLFSGVELLTLSACNTAAQQPDANGREVDAFFELAQRLGARSVLATLWPVADNSTPWLMREFYDLKVNKKQNKAEALRNAQLALLSGSSKAKRATVRADAATVKIIVADEGPKPGAATRSEKFVISKKDAKPFAADPKRPFAHPYYWAPFVLIGNWR